MTTRTKSILIITASVVAGVVIGALAVGAVVNHRVDELRALRRPAGFAPMIERVIQPQDGQQRREIQEALRRAAERNMELRMYMHERHFMILDSLRSDLEDVLTEEQMERLTEWVKRQRRPRPHRAWPPGHHRFGSDAPEGPGPPSQETR